MAAKVDALHAKTNALMTRGVGLGVRSDQVANHSLITGVPPACFPFEERERVIIQGDRDLGLPDRPPGKLIDRRQLVLNAIQLADDFPFVV